MDLNITKYVENYENSQNERFTRYRSWRYCYDFFQNEFKKERIDTNLLSLNLAFFLASWGMYRGSSKLINYDYTIHNNAVKILYRYKDSDVRELERTIALKDELIKHYKENAGNISLDMLVSKIILGTLGTSIAYDEYAKKALRELKDNNLQQTFSRKGIKKLLQFYQYNKDEIDSLCYKYNYPIMKILDMYLFEYGKSFNKKRLTIPHNL